MSIIRTIISFAACLCCAHMAAAEGTWTTYTRGDVVSVIAFDGAFIWKGTWQGVGKWNPADGSGKRYTTRDGLAGDMIYALTIDRRGVVWAGTMYGVSRFDGSSWKTFTVTDGLADNTVNAIVEDAGGRIWCATHTGISVFDGTVWKSYTSADGLAAGYVQSLAIDRKGTI